MWQRSIIDPIRHAIWVPAFAGMSGMKRPPPAFSPPLGSRLTPKPPHWPLPPPEPADLADAALAKRDGGAGRLLRRRLLRALVGRVFGLHPSAVRFARDARGAPGLAGLPGFVSTAGCTANGEGWSAVALSPYPVGVDLEAGAASEALARWTLTESYLKALGQGLFIAPEQVRLTPADRGGAGWRLALDGAMSAEGWVRSFPSVTAGVVLLDSN